jgi:hypothetical protein
MPQTGQTLSMTDTDILRHIASAFSERKSSAALSNYLVLSNNIKYVNDVLRFAVHVFSGIESAAARSLATPSNCTPDYRDAASHAPFTQIIPRVVANGLAVLEKFVLHTGPMIAVASRSKMSANSTAVSWITMPS